MLLIWINHCDFFDVRAGKLEHPQAPIITDAGCEALFHLKFAETPSMSESRTEYKLKSPPEDGITNVTFGPNSSQVGAEKTAWVK